MIRVMGARKTLEGRMWDKEKGRRGRSVGNRICQAKTRFSSVSGKRWRFLKVVVKF